MKQKIVVNAQTEHLREVTEFVDNILTESKCPLNICRTVDIVLEEIYMNIASYAYNGYGDENVIEIECEIADNTIRLKFSDEGVRYNPLKKDDPDLDAHFSERKVGGLGIYMVKNMVDNIRYEYADNKNTLSIEKIIN